MEAEILAWLVPTALAALGAVFLTLRLNGSGSYWWPAAYGFAALGFALTILPVGRWGIAKPVLEDAMFLLAIAAISCGLARRFGAPPGYIVIAVLVASGTAAAALALAVFESVPAEVFLVQTACVLLLLHTARTMQGRLRGPIDRILLGLCLALALSLALQNAVFMAVPDKNLTIHNWRLSSWAFVFQTSGAIAGILFAFAILVAIGLDLIETLRSSSETDALSGVLNRRGFEAVVRRFETRGRGAVMILDVDRFKAINDGYGHAAGDLTIAGIGAFLDAFVGTRGTVGRIGGEEFAVLLEGAGERDAAAFADRLLKALAATDWPPPLSDIRITASVGVSACRPGEPFAAALDRADRRLYRAKREGRNRVVATDPPLDPPLRTAA